MNKQTIANTFALLGLLTTSVFVITAIKMNEPYVPPVSTPTQETKLEFNLMYAPYIPNNENFKGYSILTQNGQPVTCTVTLSRFAHPGLLYHNMIDGWAKFGAVAYVKPKGVDCPISRLNSQTDEDRDWQKDIFFAVKAENLDDHLDKLEEHEEAYVRAGKIQEAKIEKNRDRRVYVLEEAND